MAFRLGSAHRPKSIASDLWPRSGVPDCPWPVRGLGICAATRAAPPVRGAARHRCEKFLAPAQDLLLPPIAAAGIVTGDALLGGFVPLNRLTDETRCADCRLALPAAVDGGCRIAIPASSPAIRAGAVRRRRGLLREPLPPAPQPVPDIDTGLPALRCRAAALPQGLPGSERALRPNRSLAAEAGRCDACLSPTGDDRGRPACPHFSRRTR